MKKLIFLTLFAFLFIGVNQAQRWKLRRYEAMIGIGTTNYFGDVGGAATEKNWFGLKDLELTHTRPSFYIGARYKIEQNISIKVNFLYGFLSGDDAGSKNNDRAYKFTSSLFEPSIVGEYYFISEEQRRRSAALFSRRGMINNYSRIGAYAFAGLGAAIFNPKLEANLTYRTPEEYSGYSKVTLAIPLGLGLKYVVNDNFSVALSLGGRLTLSDYLDSFKPRVSANKAKDIYYFSSLAVVYRIKTNKLGRPIIFKRSRF